MHRFILTLNIIKCLPRAAQTAKLNCERCEQSTTAEATKKQHYKSNKRHIILYYTALCTVCTQAHSVQTYTQIHTLA